MKILKRSLTIKNESCVQMDAACSLRVKYFIERHVETVEGINLMKTV